MKQLNKKYFTIAVYAVAVLVFAIAFLLIGLHFPEVTAFILGLLAKVSSVFYGIAISLVLLPLVKLMDRFYKKIFCRKKDHPFVVIAFSLTSTYLLVFVVVIASILLILPNMVRDFRELYGVILAFFAEISFDLSDLQSLLPNLSALLEKLPFGRFAPIVNDILHSFFDYIEQLVANITAAGNLVSKLVAIIFSVASHIADFLLAFVISIYLLASRRFLCGVGGKLVVAIFPPKFATKFVVFFKRLYTDMVAFSSARIFLSFLVSCAIFALSWIFGIPMFSVIVLILFAFQLFPVVGTSIGVLLASSIVLILDPIKAIFFIPSLIAIEILASKFLAPFLLSKKLRPAYGLQAILVVIGNAILGPIGAFLAVPLYVTFDVEVRNLLTHRLAKKHMPISSKIYEEHSFADAILHAEAYAQAKIEAEKSHDDAHEHKKHKHEETEEKED